LTRTNAVGKTSAQRGIAVVLRSQGRELNAGAEDNELAEFDAIGPQLTPEFVERRLDGLGLSDRMAAAFGRHRSSVAPVSHHLSVAERRAQSDLIVVANRALGSSVWTTFKPGWAHPRICTDIRAFRRDRQTSSWRNPGKIRAADGVGDLPESSAKQGAQRGQSRARPPFAPAKLQVFGVVGREDEQIDHMARRAGGEEEGAPGE
jgi:hypothetical protein